MSKKQKTVKKENTGLSSLVLKIIAYVITVSGIIFTINGTNRIEGLNYLSWISFPIFAYFVAVGFDETSSKLRYFLRLLLFAVLAEFPYDYIKTGSLFSTDCQNGMLTLVLGFIVIAVTTFIYKKTKNIVLCGLVAYLLGLGLYWVARSLSFECYSFGIMFTVMFYVSRHCKYTKLLQIGFVAFLVLVVTSETSLSFIIGNIQYSMPYRIFSLIPVLLIWLYNGKQGPYKLWISIAQYCFYPAVLSVACLFL